MSASRRDFDMGMMGFLRVADKRPHGSAERVVESDANTPVQGQVTNHREGIEHPSDLAHIADRKISMKTNVTVVS
jgi:hypothetical protein